MAQVFKTQEKQQHCREINEASSKKILWISFYNLKTHEQFKSKVANNSFSFLFFEDDCLK